MPAAPSRSTSTTTASNVSPTCRSRIAASSVETIPASYWPALRSDTSISSGSDGSADATQSGTRRSSDSATHVSPT